METHHSPGGGKSHVCSKCGWNYPNPHPSAKNRRAHKKICGTIKGFEILGSDQNLDLQKEEHCLDDEQKTPSPRVVVDERIGDISEEDVFADAVCEFSSSLSFKEKEEETAAKCETEHSNKSPEVVQESLDVPVPVQVLENLPSSVEAEDTGGESSADSMVEQSRDEAQVIHDGRTITNAGLETECKGNVADESESMLASALGKRVDISASSWNDEVIYSDLEGPHGFEFAVEAMNMNPPGEPDHTTVNPPGEADYTTVSDKNPPAPVEDMNMNPPGEADYTTVNPPGEADSTAVSDKNLVDTTRVETVADQAINTTLPALDAIPSAENAHISLNETKGLEDKLPLEDLNIGREVPSPDMLPLEDKTEPQGQTSLVALPSEENIVMPKIDPELQDIKMKPEAGASQETVDSETMRTSLPTVDPIVTDSNADVSHSELIAPESELIQANVVAEEKINPISELSSESSCAVEHHVSPVSVVALEGDEPSVIQNKSSTETSKNSILQTSESTDKEDCTTTPNQKLLEKGKTEPNKVVGGLGVIQANEIDDGNVAKAHNNYAEVPVTIESNDHRDFGRLQNLSEAQIRSLVLSPLVTRDNTTSNAISGHKEPENDLSKNQEITTSWSTGKEEHVPLKNLLNEARSPKVVVAAETTSKIQRVSSILDQETSPEGDSGWPERREVSEEWNSPAKYPVERKVKGRPFWVPFVCCSSSAK